MNDTFYDGHHELYHHAKFGEDRTMRAGCRCENVVFALFVCLSRFESGAPCVRGVHSYPRRARSALGVDTVLTLDVCMYVSALERKRLNGMT